MQVRMVGLDLGLKRVGYVVYQNGAIVEADVVTVENFSDLYYFALRKLQNAVVVCEVPVPFGKSPTTILQLAAQVGIVWTVVEEMFCLTRPDVKSVLLHTTRAKDKDVRARLKAAIENYEIIVEPHVKLKGDAWSALAVLYAYFVDPAACHKGQSGIWTNLTRKFRAALQLCKIEDDEKLFRHLVEEANKDGMDKSQSEQETVIG